MWVEQTKLKSLIILRVHGQTKEEGGRQVQLHAFNMYMMLTALMAAIKWSDILWTIYCGLIYSKIEGHSGDQKTLFKVLNKLPEEPNWIG